MKQFFSLGPDCQTSLLSCLFIVPSFYQCIPTDVCNGKSFIITWNLHYWGKWQCFSRVLIQLDGQVFISSHSEALFSQPRRTAHWGLKGADNCPVQTSCLYLRPLLPSTRLWVGRCPRTEQKGRVSSCQAPEAPPQAWACWTQLPSMRDIMPSFFASVHHHPKIPSTGILHKSLRSESYNLCN